MKVRNRERREKREGEISKENKERKILERQVDKEALRKFIYWMSFHKLFSKVLV